MACRSDYMEPNEREVQTTKAARLLIYVMSALDSNWKPSPLLSKMAETAYPDTSHLDNYTRSLCEILKDLNEAEQNRIIYDGRNRDARELAEWWEHHQEADKKREYQKISDNDEHFMNSLIGFIQTEKALAEKNLRPMDRLKLHKYITANLE